MPECTDQQQLMFFIVFKKPSRIPQVVADNRPNDGSGPAGFLVAGFDCSPGTQLTPASGREYPRFFRLISVMGCRSNQFHIVRVYANGENVEFHGCNIQKCPEPGSSFPVGVAVPHPINFPDKIVDLAIGFVSSGPNPV